LAIGQLSKSGDSTTFRFLFAKSRLNERYGDITPIETPLARQ
jgi:hypothetical protein